MHSRIINLIAHVESVHSERDRSETMAWYMQAYTRRAEMHALRRYVYLYK
jgi:hypothetical protein